MNTRLQVEHPVTELVTGVDLVKLQLRVAAGEPLPFRQEDLRQRGHAIECRIYAEDPANGFLPAIGRVLTAVEPVGPGVRVDAGVTGGDVVTLHYDPMIAKLIVLGENRADAIGKLHWALGHYVILGDVITNIPFLRDVLTHPDFSAGRADHRLRRSSLCPLAARGQRAASPGLRRGGSGGAAAPGSKPTDAAC